MILSRLCGHDEVGVGTLIGSNLFNGLVIVGVAGTIHPIAAPPGEVALTLSAGIVALLLCCYRTATAVSCASPAWGCCWSMLALSGRHSVDPMN